MKKTLLLIILLICITSLSAQQPGLNMYVLHFTDKGINKNSAINPSIYLSDKSVERRLKRKIAFDQADVPVNDQYVQEISKTGARILARSRWFNTVVIEANTATVDQIEALPYISKAQQLTSGAKQPLTSTSEKPFWENETVSPWIGGISKNVLADKYNYGAAYNQISQLNGQYLHNMGYSGEGMTIAVIDAGFNSVDVMTCFESLRTNNQIKGTRDFAEPGNNVYATTMNSHGTMVLSCMGANSSGLMVGTAPKADYWLLRSEVGATESIIEEYYWVSAAEFADSIGADMINSSLGYTEFKESPEADHTYADMDGNTTIVTKGADKAAEKGILVVNSAGNDGNKTWKYIGAPADGDSVFTIGAVNASGIKASFSSFGPTADGRIKPTVSAQGEGSAVFTPAGQGNANGTSFSSPIICGITACLWQAMSDLNNMQIIETIKVTASQSSQPDELLGWGIPDYQLAFTTLSVADKAVQKTLVTYPNPVNDKLTVGFPVPVQGKYRFEIVNLQGKVVYSHERNEGSIRSIQVENIRNIPSGIYFIKVTTGLVIYSGKIIKM